MYSFTDLLSDGQHTHHTGRRAIILAVSIHVLDDLGDELGIVECTRPHRAPQAVIQVKPHRRHPRACYNRIRDMLN